MNRKTEGSTTSMEHKIDVNRELDRTQFPLDSLPLRVLLRIARVASVPDVIALSQTSRALHTLCVHDLVWEPRLILLNAKNLIPPRDILVAATTTHQSNPEPLLRLLLRSADDFQPPSASQISQGNPPSHVAPPTTEDIANSTTPHVPPSWPILHRPDANLSPSLDFANAGQQCSSLHERNSTGSSPALSPSSSAHFHIETSDPRTKTITAFVPGVNARILLDKDAISRLGETLLASPSGSSADELLPTSSYTRGPQGTAFDFFVRIYQTLLPYYKDLLVRQRDSLLFRRISDPKLVATVLRRMAVFHILAPQQQQQQQQTNPTSILPQQGTSYSGSSDTSQQQLYSYSSHPILTDHTYSSRKHTVDAIIDWFESTLLSRFERAYDNSDIADMTTCSLAAYNLNGGRSCVQLFVSKHPIFFDSEFNPSLVLKLVQPRSSTNARDSRGTKIRTNNGGGSKRGNKSRNSPESSYELTDEFARYSAHIIRACQEQVRIISKVFYIPSMDALTAFSLRLVDDSILEYLAAVLSATRERGETSVFLHALANGIYFCIQFLECIADNECDIPVQISKVRDPLMQLCSEYSSNYTAVELTNLEERLIDLVRVYYKRQERHAHNMQSKTRSQSLFVSNSEEVTNRKKKKTSSASADQSLIRNTQSKTSSILGAGKKLTGEFMANISKTSNSKVKHTLLSDEDDDDKEGSSDVVVNYKRSSTLPSVEERSPLDETLDSSDFDLRKQSQSKNKKKMLNGGIRSPSSKVTSMNDVFSNVDMDEKDTLDFAFNDINLHGGKYVRGGASYQDDIDSGGESGEKEKRSNGFSSREIATAEQDDFSYSSSDADYNDDFDLITGNSVQNIAKNRIVDTMKSVLFAPISLGKNLASIGRTRGGVVKIGKSSVDGKFDTAGMPTETTFAETEFGNENNENTELDGTTDVGDLSARSQKLLRQVNALDSIGGVGSQSLISIELCLSLLQASGESLGRALVVLSAVNPDGVEYCVAHIFMLLLEVTGLRHLRPAFDVAINKLDQVELLDDEDEAAEDAERLKGTDKKLTDATSLPLTNNVEDPSKLANLKKLAEQSGSGADGKRTVAPAVEAFFQTIQTADVVQQMFDIYFQEDIRQWVNESAQDFLTELGMAKKRFDHMLDDYAAAGMDKCLRIMINQLEFIYVLELDPADYNQGQETLSSKSKKKTGSGSSKTSVVSASQESINDKAAKTGSPDSVVDITPTKLCKRTVRLLKEYWHHVTQITDRQMVDVFFSEAALRVFDVILKHLKRIQISQLGAQQLVCDFNMYFEWAKSTGIPSVIEQFTTLKEVAFIFLADGTADLKRISADVARSRNAHVRLEDMHQLLRSRTDYRRIHSSLRSNECVVQ